MEEKYFLHILICILIIPQNVGIKHIDDCDMSVPLTAVYVHSTHNFNKDA